MGGDFENKYLITSITGRITNRRAAAVGVLGGKDANHPFLICILFRVNSCRPGCFENFILSYQRGLKRD